MTASPSSVLICGCGAGKPVPRKLLRQYKAVWSVNNCFTCCKVEPDLVIAIDDFRRDEEAEPGYAAKLFKGHNARVVTTVAYQEWPRAVAYPLSRVIESLGIRREYARRLFDNSCNYALALAIDQEWRRIGLYGMSFARPYSKAYWRDVGMLDWERTPYQGRLRPDWFKYHGRIALISRQPTEPGSEAFHTLLGIALARGVDVAIYNSTLLNLDREAYYYGFQEQPDV